MKRLYSIVLSCVVLAVIGGGLYRAIAQQPQKASPTADMLDQTDETVARRKHVRDVYMRNVENLRKNPNVFGIVPRNDHILIVTDRPNVVPKMVEDVEVKIQEPPPHLPAPKGVVVVFDDGTYKIREHQQKCERPYHIERRHYRWRFCTSESQSYLPTRIMIPPVAGIPFEKAKEIYLRHAEWLYNLPGVTHMELNNKGIVVGTSQPEQLPSDIEGLPVIIEKPRPKNIIDGADNHTSNSSVAPLQGGSRQPTSPLTDTALSAGLCCPRGSRGGLLQTTATVTVNNTPVNREPLGFRSTPVHTTTVLIRYSTHP
jgi:hypothetical protein